MAEVISRRSVVYDILFDVSQGKKSIKEAEQALGGLDKKANTVVSTIEDLGKSFIAAFAVERVIEFAKHASELADKAKNVASAFERLNGISLQKLRESTGGAVDDLTLMQKALQAANFKVPLGELEKLFRFATIRAKETGDSVNNLIDSIVEGLGGGSARAFKTLGISSDEFARKIKETGNATKAVTSIIDDSFKKTGSSLNGMVDAQDKLSTSVTNFEITLGKIINEGFLDDFKDFLGNVIQLTTDLLSGQRDYNEELEKTGKIIKKFTEEDVVNMISSTEALIEIRKQEADQGFALSEEQKQAILDRFKAQTQAEIDATKTLDEETTKQVNIVREKEEDILFDPDLFFKQRKILLDAFTEIGKILSTPIEIKPQIDTTGLDAFSLKLTATSDEAATFAEVVHDNSSQLSQDLAATFGNLGQLAKEGSKAQIALSFANVLAANAEALAQAIKSAAAIPFPGNIPAIATSVALITGLFASVKGIMSQAQSASSTSTTATAFAEGEVDIHRPGEKRGKDSIPAIIMPGESVMTTDATSQYKPFLEAIRDGNLEDLIRVNYIEPALAVKALDHINNDSRQIDYSEKLYRQLLEQKEGNVIHKRSIKILASIDYKLTPKQSRYSH